MNRYFANPEFKWLFLLLGVYVLWYFLWYARKRVYIPLSYDPAQLKKTGLNLNFLRFLPMILQLAGMGFIIFALMRPQSSSETTNRFSEGIDIMLLLDTSGSMDTDDFKPNRLEVAKEKAEQFIQGRLNDRIGIILFAEDAFSYAPLTLDYELLRKQIRSISSNIMPKEGTAMGSAIAIGINRMLESESPSKVMILLTDGANNRGQIEPAVAAKLARQEGIKIYSIGIGKKEFTRRGMFGNQTIKSDLDEAALKEIADITKGQFFRSTNEKGLESIFGQISAMEKTEIMEEVFKEVYDYYPRSLVYGILLIVISFILMATFLYNPLED